MKIIEKPWGKEEILEENEKYVLKRLTMFKGHRCSLQYHKIKKETIYVLSGKLRIFIGKSEKNLTSKLYKEKEVITIPPGMVHRMEGEEDSVYLEASTPEMDDVVRTSDDYNRAESK